MKTSKEFFEKLQSDEAFAQEIGTKVKEKFDAGETDYKSIWISVSAEYGYELTSEELEEWYEAATAELTDEELGNVAGGTTPTIGLGIFSFIATAASSGVISYYVADSRANDCDPKEYRDATVRRF